MSGVSLVGDTEVTRGAYRHSVPSPVETLPRKWGWGFEGSYTSVLPDMSRVVVVSRDVDSSTLAALGVFPWVPPTIS